ncbi:MAG: hypothetical protein FRX49_11788 [Trebouxia sp. A1-2]|nr:MAG: hypothetical protein FRX49_11788 [Trebouxia sp. A1-2]
MKQGQAMVAGQGCCQLFPPVLELLWLHCHQPPLHHRLALRLRAVGTQLWSAQGPEAMVKPCSGHEQGLLGAALGRAPMLAAELWPGSQSGLLLTALLAVAHGFLMAPHHVLGHQLFPLHEAGGAQQRQAGPGQSHQSYQPCNISFLALDSACFRARRSARCWAANCLAAFLSTAGWLAQMGAAAVADDPLVVLMRASSARRSALS